MRNARFVVSSGNGFETERRIKSGEVFLCRDADRLRTPRLRDVPQGFEHQAAAQSAAAVTGIDQNPAYGDFVLDDSCGDDPQECDDAAVFLHPEKDALRIDGVGVGGGDMLFEEKDGSRACTMRWYSAAEISLKCLITTGYMVFVG